MYKEKTLSLIDAERAILKETIDLFFSPNVMNNRRQDF